MELIFVFILLILQLLYSKYFEDPKDWSDNPFNFEDERVNEPTHVGNMFMSASHKRDYLSSSSWTTKRSLVLKRDNHQCTSCSSKHNLQCHHITYERLGDEQLSDLTTLCANCHQAIHDKLGYDRKTLYNVY